MPPAQDIISVIRSSYVKQESSEHPKKKLKYEVSFCDNENSLDISTKQELKIEELAHKEKSADILAARDLNLIKFVEKKTTGVKSKPKTEVQKVLVSLGGEIGCGRKIDNYLSTRYKKSSDAVAAFCCFVYLRQEIFEARSAGNGPPYTSNAILSSKWFTNMYRELDRGTKFYRYQILSEHDLSNPSHQNIIFQTIVYRLVNKIETFEEYGKLPKVNEWKSFEMFLTEKMDQGEVAFTSAHQNMGLRRFCETMDEVLDSINELTYRIIGAGSINECFDVLKGITNIGNFFAWQILCDFLELKIVTFDENEWTCLGPGAKAGLRKIFEVKSESEELTLTKHLTKIMSYCFKSLELNFPYFLNRKLTLKNIEHALCEYDKYYRFALNHGTRDRCFQSREVLDMKLCLACNDIISKLDRKCVLCGSCCHVKCLDNEGVLTLVDNKWWLCSVCYDLEFRDDGMISEYPPSFDSDEFIIKHVNIVVKNCMCIIK